MCKILLRYKKPKICIISLDPGSAILATCKEGGAYFRTVGTTICVYATSPTSPNACKVNAKLESVTNTGASTATADTLPS